MFRVGAGLTGEDVDESFVLILSRFVAPTAAPIKDRSGPRVGLKNSDEADAWKNGLGSLGPSVGVGELEGVLYAEGITPSGAMVVPVVISVPVGLGLLTSLAVGLISRISSLAVVRLPRSNESPSSPVGRGLPSPA